MDNIKAVFYLLAIVFLLIEIIKATEIIPRIIWFFREWKEKRREEQKEPFVYVEKFTKCDTCPMKSDACYLLDITTALDSQRHFISGIGGRCEMEGDVND